MGVPPEQVPQVWVVPPQPFETEPHLPEQAVPIAVGVQPQTLATPAPAQVWGEVQVPQVYVPPQPFETVPQFLPLHAVVIAVGVQPQTLAVPPPPQVWGEVQPVHV
jgi:hypothetical protein